MAFTKYYLVYYLPNIAWQLLFTIPQRIIILSELFKFKNNFVLPDCSPLTRQPRPKLVQIKFFKS